MQSQINWLCHIKGYPSVFIYPGEQIVEVIEEFRLRDLKKLTSQCPLSLEESFVRSVGMSTCLDGPWMTCSDVRSGRSPAVQACKGVHPYPMPFQKSVILWPGVKYRLSLNMKWTSCSEGESKLLNLFFVFHLLFHNLFVTTKRSLSQKYYKLGLQYPKNLYKNHSFLWPQSCNYFPTSFQSRR